MASKKAVTSPSKPSTDRAPHRAKTKLKAVAEPSGNQVQAESVPDLPPTATQIANLLAGRGTNRGTAAPLNREAADAYVVDCLPNFRLDHRSDSTAARIPCGDITGIDGWREEIQVRFTDLCPNYFRITPRLSGKFTKGQWVEFVDTPKAMAPKIEATEDWADEEEFEAEEVAEPVMTAQQFKLYVENVRLKERLAALERQSTQPNPATAQPRKKSAIEEVMDEVLAVKMRELLLSPAKPQEAPALTPEVVLAKAIVENPAKFGTFTEKLMKKVLGDPEEEESGKGWAAVLAPLVEQVANNLPGIVQIVGMQARAPMAQTTVQPQPNMPAQQEGQGQQLSVDEASATAGGSQAVSAVDPILAYQQLLQRVLYGLEQNEPVAVVGHEIKGFYTVNPQFKEFVLEFIDNPVEEMLATVGTMPGAAHLPGLPHAAEWVKALQNEFFDEDGDDAEELEQASAAASAG